MASIVAISGSLRGTSFNTQLLRAAAALMPDGSTLDVRTLHDIPLYNGDVEAASGLPQPVVVLKDAIARADGLLLATPEYNSSIPGVFKNAIDWCSRPPSDIARVFGDRPTALIGASAGAFGTQLAQAAWLPVLRALGADTWNGGRLFVTRAREVFDADGAIVDEAVRERVRKLLAAFVAYAER